MSVAQASNTSTIYIPLLDEGLPVFRPTQGLPLHGETFLVLPSVDYDPNDEIWEFPPGSKVTCGYERHEGEDILVARALVTHSQT